MFQVSTALHEIMHALGMAHEQQRSDRDLFIKLLPENIDLDNMHNFDKESTDDEQPYDVESVLQYTLEVSLLCVLLFFIVLGKYVSLLNICMAICQL